MSDGERDAQLGRIDHNLLLPLRALLEMRHVSRAAERIHLSQPAMSAALGRLRRHFDDELLVRVGGAYQLTPLATRLQTSVAIAVQALDDVWREAGAFDPSSSTRRFTLTSSAYAMAVLMPGLWRTVAAQAPGITLDWRGMPHDVLSESDTLRTDLMICPLGFGLPGAHERLFDDDFVFVYDGTVHVARPAPGDRVTREFIAANAHVTTSFVTALSAVYYDLFASLGIPRAARIVVDEWAMLPAVVEGTELLGLMPRRLALRHCVRAPFVIAELPADCPPATFTEALFWHSSRNDDRGIQWLRERFHDAVPQL